MNRFSVTCFESAQKGLSVPPNVVVDVDAVVDVRMIPNTSASMTTPTFLELEGLEVGARSGSAQGAVRRMRRREPGQVPIIVWSLVTALLVVAPPRRASCEIIDVPFVVVQDDGSLADNGFRTTDQLNEAASTLLSAYRDTGSPLPEVISVWSTFPFGASSLSTLYVPIGNDVEGIGLETVYGGDGTLRSPAPPLSAMLLHNDVTDIEARAARHDAPVEGYAQYLFLLELSHRWGPAVQVAGDQPGALIGFTFHWSFWLDSGAAPAGGNRWIDNGDGTFTTANPAPGEVSYSPLDLYVMGLLGADEVSPFFIIESPVAPADARDAINGGRVSQNTFPWFSDEPLTVSGVRRDVTIDEIIDANGARLPSFGEAPTSFTLGILLVLDWKASDEEALEGSLEFAPIASSLAPAFARATGERGALEVVTQTSLEVPDDSDSGPGLDAGPGDDAGDADSGLGLDAGGDGGLGDGDVVSDGGPEDGAPSEDPPQGGCTCCAPRLRSVALSLLSL